VEFNDMSFRKMLTLSLVVALVAVTSVASAAPIFYLSTSSSPSSTAPTSNLQLTAGAPGTTGTLYLYAKSTDLQLSAVSLDLLSSNPNTLKFTGNPTVSNGGAWAFLDGPTVVSDGSVTHLGGGAIAGVSGAGIGHGSPTGDDFLIASIPYTFGAGPGPSNLSLQVAGNEIVAWDGSYPTVQFGNTTNGTQVTGDFAPGKVGVAGVVNVPEPATLALIGLVAVGGLGLRRRS
jgi:hypothetical protein